MSVEWGLAARLAGLAGADAGVPGPPPVDLVAVGEQARERIVAVTGLDLRREPPPIEWVSRETWVAANLDMMRTTVGPALERSTARAPGPVRAAAGAMVAAEIGGLLGMLSKRVLGQYDVRLLEAGEEPRLLLVAANLENAARELGVDRAQLVTWVTLHEVTHAVQFGSVDWLKDHLGGLLGQLLASLEVRPDARAALRLDLADLRALAERVREGGLMLAVAGPERRALLDEVQATMALVEGHAEWAMDRAGRDVLRDVDGLRAALTRRRSGRSPLLKVLDRLFGFELKLRQYEVGREFCDAVVAAGGEGLLLQAWSSPAAVPTLPELAAPDLWLARMRPAA